MRNPWGKKGEWSGDWSDSSDLWTPELSELVGQTNQDDGIFFIPLENYLTHFTQTSVSISDSSNVPISMAKFKNDETVYYEFTLKKDTPHLSITLNQSGDRIGHYRPEDREDLFEPSDFSMILINADTNEIVGTPNDCELSGLYFQYTMFV